MCTWRIYCRISATYGDEWPLLHHRPSPPFFFLRGNFFFFFDTVQFKCTESLDYGVSNKVPVASRQKIKREGDSGEFFFF